MRGSDVDVGVSVVVDVRMLRKKRRSSRRAKGVYIGCGGM